MVLNEVSKIYAGALLELGIENNILPRIEEELSSIVDLISADKDFRLLIYAPVVPRDKKKELIGKIFGDKFCPDIVSFLKVVIDNNRQSLLPDIYKSFIDLTDRINNTQRIKVTTSRKQEPDELRKIEEFIGKKFKKKIIIEEVIDESILGGMIIRIDDMLIDGSIARNLNNLKSRLIERKVDSGVAYED